MVAKKKIEFKCDCGGVIKQAWLWRRVNSYGKTMDIQINGSKCTQCNKEYDNLKTN